MATPDLSFGAWIRQQRAQRDLTQERLAALVGCAVQTIRAFESGARRPSRTLSERLADVLELGADERPSFMRLARVPNSRDAAVSGPNVVKRAPPVAARPLSLPTTPLIGREVERDDLLRRLRVPEQRLVTLVGPGGMGKTSLALHVAAQLAAAHAPAFADGVAVVYLAAVARAGDVSLALAESLGYPVQGARPVLEQMIDTLRELAILIVLDNAEHLLDRDNGDALATLIGRLLVEAPRLRLLVTSRERLHLREEWVVELGGLGVPATKSGPRVERAEAVQLFVERARHLMPGFDLTNGNRQAVAHICCRLDGMPLAIELAASWTRVLTPTEVAAEIDRALDFLAVSDRDVPARHRSMRAALDHSWILLSHDERLILARLSVFQGGCDRHAATDVTGATLPTLMALIDKSLLRREEAGGVTRYTLHELVRQYAAEQLAADHAEQQTTATRHAAYYAGLLQRSITTQTGGSSPEAWATLTHNIDNLRAAWLRATTVGDTATVLAMARGLMILYDNHGWLLDGATLFERAANALHAAGIVADAALGLTLGIQGSFLIWAGRPAAAALLLDEAVGMVQAAGNTADLAHLLLDLGIVEINAARLDAAHERAVQAAQLAQASGDYFTQLWATFIQGMIATFNGDFLAAERFFSTCLATWRTQGYSRGVAAAGQKLSEVARLGGHVAAAETHVRESLRVSSAARDTSSIAWSLREVGAIALERGDLDEAYYLLSESCDSLRGLGNMWNYSRSRSLLVRLQVKRGDVAAARRGCAELLQLVRDGMGIALPEAAYGLALILVAEGNAPNALAVLDALNGTPGEYATLALATTLRVTLEQQLNPAQRAATLGRPRADQLVPWLEELCARPAAPITVTAATGKPSSQTTPIVPAGALFVAETGETLSPREIEVLGLLIAGASNQMIADTLIISLYTVKHHVASILQKLHVATRTQAALVGRALGVEPRAPQ